jgi:hypothetical protein
MSRLSRFTQLIFGSTAGADQIAQFGSLAAGSPVYTTALNTIQALGNYATGWFAGILGSNSPAIEDMNSLFYLITSQLAYLFQLGVPEWDAGTTYYVGSLVQNGGGNIYVSLTNGNLNNALSVTSAWQYFLHQGISPWIAGVNYGSADIVTDAATGLIYTSLVANNLGNTPSTSPTQWGGIYSNTVTATTVNATTAVTTGNTNTGTLEVNGAGPFKIARFTGSLAASTSINLLTVSTSFLGFMGVATSAGVANVDYSIVGAIYSTGSDVTAKFNSSTNVFSLTNNYPSAANSYNVTVFYL